MAALAAQTTQPGTVSGSASNGLGDADILGSDGRSGTSATGETGAPANDGITYYATGTGGKITISHNLSVSSEADGSGPGSAQVGGQLGTYSVKIHATPYNWHQTSGAKGANGSIVFSYAYNSTSGSISDLTYCTGYEILTAGNGANPYTPPSPFVPLSNSSNPAKGPNGGNPLSSPMGIPNDTHSQWPTAAPYSNSMFDVHQQYVYDDSLLGTTNTLIPSSDGTNTNTITRQVYFGFAPSGWMESVTKNGVPNSASLM